MSRENEDDDLVPKVPDFSMEELSGQPNGADIKFEPNPLIIPAPGAYRPDDQPHARFRRRIFQHRSTALAKM